MKVLMSVKFIATVVVAMVVVSVSVIAVDLLSMKSYLVQEQKNNLQRQATSLADFIAHWMSDVRIEGEIYSRLKPIAGVDVKNAGAYLASELAQRKKDDGLVSNLVLVDSEGMGHYPDGNVRDLSQDEGVKVVQATRQFHFAKSPVVSPVTGKVVLALLYPVSQPGSSEGIFLYSISLDYLAQMTQKYSNQTRTVFITSSDGTFLAHPNRDFILKKNSHKMEGKDVQGLQDLAVRMDAGDQGVGTYTLAGSPATLAYHPIDGTGWSVGVSEDNRALEQELWATISTRAFYLGISALVILVLVLPFTYRMTKNLRSVRREIKLVAGDNDVKGDLTRRLHTTGTDELGAVASFFNGFLEDLQKVVNVVKKEITALEVQGYDLAANMEQTSASVVEINASLTSIERQIGRQNESTVDAQEAVQRISGQIEALEAEISQQGAIVDHGVDAIGEMVIHLDSITGHVSNLGQFVTKLIEASEAGRARLAETVRAIAEVSERSRSLEETNEVISDIASRTNVLSLNAAIEAAHAGASGRGFAVVAAEIRHLAENSARQSNEIGGSLTEIRQAIDLIVQNASATEQSFQAITEAIQTVSGTETEVRDSLVEQSEGSRQILRLLEDFRGLSKRVRASSAEIGLLNGKVHLQMEELAQVSESVRIGITEITAGTREINKALVNVESLAQGNKNAIQAVGHAVAQLRT